MTFTDLFAGIGGFHYALSSIGGRCVTASEMDEGAASMYCANHGIAPVGDIRELDGLPAHDVMCAGFPCQPFSIAGNRAGEADGRAYGWREVARLAKLSDPKAVLMENSPRLCKDPTFPRLQQAFEDMGYVIHYQTLNASDFGVPQNRDRLYIVAVKRGRTFHFPEVPCTPVRLRDVLGVPPRDTHPPIKNSDLYVPTFTWDEAELNRNRPVRVGTIGKGGQGNRVYHEDGHAVTQCATSGGIGRFTGLYLIDGQIRRLSVREGLRCQGFPETFVPHPNDSTAYFHTGNAVAVPVVAAIAANLKLH